MVGPQVMLVGQDDFNLSDLLYLLIFFVFPLLNSLGAKIREKFGESSADADADSEFGPVAPKGSEQAPPDRGVLERTRRAGEQMRRPNAPPAPASSAPKPPPIAKPVPTTHRRDQPIARPVAPRKRQPTPKRGRRPAAPSTGRSRAPQSQNAREDRLTTVEWLVAEEEELHAGTSRPHRRSPLPERVDVATLRSAVVLSEILQPPLALREERYGGWQL